MADIGRLICVPESYHSGSNQFSSTSRSLLYSALRLHSPPVQASDEGIPVIWLEWTYNIIQPSCIHLHFSLKRCKTRTLWWHGLFHALTVHTSDTSRGKHGGKPALCPDFLVAINSNPINISYSDRSDHIPISYNITQSHDARIPTSASTAFCFSRTRLFNRSKVFTFGPSIHWSIGTWGGPRMGLSDNPKWLVKNGKSHLMLV